MSAGFSLDTSKLFAGMSELETKAQAAVRMYAETSALKLQNYARKNRPWTDRTGQARQRLTGDVLIASNGYRLRLAQGVDYGIFLELEHEKRFAIIMPTIEYIGSNEIMPGFRNLLERLE